LKELSSINEKTITATTKTALFLLVHDTITLTFTADNGTNFLINKASVAAWNVLKATANSYIHKQHLQKAHWLCCSCFD